MFTYDEAKEYLIENFSRSANSHVSDELSKIGEGLQKLNQDLPRTGDQRFTKLHIALNFWDGWQDARNHDWKYYEDIKPYDLPNLAKIIVEDLKNDREITDEKILAHFALRPKESIGRKLKRLFKPK